ncbi:VWA domain-containing protein [Trueperella pecoris]|uniref:VWA domain-containing protein n=1 Tax=Trueperella pecoris TaxID=2733571 RepID=A0A7M1R0T1_9ACTO|nr:vWA domain-containing protein [Trueperella pecoris]QOR47880.1 VWA domain-containing protein [Trueperella pecoris]
MNFQFLIPPLQLAIMAGLGLAGIAAGAWSQRDRWVAWIRRALMLAMAVAMGLAPGVVVQTRTLTSNLAVFFVVDATGSMAAEDYDGGRPRLEGVKADALAIMDALPNAHYAVVEYSSSASQQLPLTTDKAAVRTWIDVYDRELTDFSAGSSVNRPVEEVALLLENLRARNGGTYVPVVIVMTDGESTDALASTRAEAPDFSRWKALVSGGVVLGYGTEAGAPMLRREADVVSTEHIKAPGGALAVSKANPAALQTIADQVGVPYVHRSAPGGIGEIVEQMGGVSVSTGTEESLYSPVIWPFAAVFAVLMAWELFDLMPRLRVVAAMTIKRATLDPNRGRRES